ncbi:hypothetical protein BGZ98_008376 [Dissophora globulifera]|nr:hypothetical protein BGZ98_008376 [Dissophora globulifera]
MENVPEHDLVFLNELHDRLRRLDPRRTPNAGLYRVLGRLIEYDLERQIAKIESCFHQHHTSSPRIAARPTVALKSGPPTSSLKRKRGSSNVFSSDGGANRGGSSGTEGTLKREQTLVSTSSLVAAAETNGFIDLTSTTDEDNSDDENRDGQLVDRLSKSIAPVLHHVTNMSQNNAVRGLKAAGGPKVILWIDTRMLDPWNYEFLALFHFMGEVVYESGHWILQARICRNMEGLDLYSYRQSILLTRELVASISREERPRFHERDRPLST